MKKRDNYLEERATKYIYQYIKYEHVNKYIAEYFRKKLVYRYGIWIGRDCKIGEGLTLPHPQGIVIGNGVHIGKNVTLFQQVTLGKNQGGYPYIESGTTIYPGARVIGKIRIGRNTVIGTQAVVMQSTEMNSIYAGVPAKRIK